MNEPGIIYHFDRSYALSQPEFDGMVLFQIGEQYTEAGFSIEEHQQWCYEITYIESGSATSYTDDMAYEVHAGDVIIHGKNCRHNMIANPGSRLRFLYLGFDVSRGGLQPGGPIGEILKYFDTTTEPCKSDRFGVGDMLHKMLQEFYCEYAGFHEAVASYLRLIVWMAYRNSHWQSVVSGMQSDSEESVGATVYRIVRYVDEHLCEIDSIRSIANELNYNYSYLSFIFKKKTGTTLQRYIVNKKMEKARSFLGERGMSITQTANALGYKSAQAFSKVFSGTYGMSPSAYLEQRKREEPK